MIVDPNYFSTYFREYDPVLGRFNGIDPLAAKFDMYSPYHYAYNDPVNFSDPTGAYPDGLMEGNSIDPSDPLNYFDYIQAFPWLDPSLSPLEAMRIYERNTSPELRGQYGFSTLMEDYWAANGLSQDDGNGNYWGVYGYQNYGRFVQNQYG